ncbi:hypothetical protein BE21_19925 [Sorangium cellulosum]|uniref:Uncharacterized protein n=1 Tax=Sorangium cellulosum TaxID=56 RepID=A0A150TWN0_SORCE|nr:hypothetical protein BE21_19925 [Sorangium cellulosum]
MRMLHSHHSPGMPRYLRARHPMAMALETCRPKKAGLLTSTAVPRLLGIGITTLRRLDSKRFEPVPRQESRKMQVSTTQQVKVLWKAILENTRHGLKPELIGLEEVARRAA